ncbi:MAG TPA: DUF3667 domain-containing protein [Ideonella sp.]|nr:DUF3667 domain-containing protein [Ideonella sp.]
MSAIQPPWTCPNCKSSLSTPFCPQCGERPLPKRDLTLRGVAGKVLHATTTIDGRLMRSFALLLRRPGFLTVAYMEGRRTPYLAPFKLFLAANALFFAIHSLTGVNVFSSPLASHLHQQDWSVLAQSLVATHLQSARTSLADYAPVFDRQVVLYAKLLIVLMVLPFALLVSVVYRGARKPLMTHVSFSLHLYAFLLLLFSVCVLAGKADELLGGAGLSEPWLDNLLSVVNLVACGAYLHVSSGPVFAARGASRLLKAAGLALCAGAIVIGYRFVLLPITLFTT